MRSCRLFAKDSYPVENYFQNHYISANQSGIVSLWLHCHHHHHNELTCSEVVQSKRRRSRTSQAAWPAASLPIWWGWGWRWWGWCWQRCSQGLQQQTSQSIISKSLLTWYPRSIPRKHHGWVAPYCEPAITSTGKSTKWFTRIFQLIYSVIYNIEEKLVSAINTSWRRRMCS